MRHVTVVGLLGAQRARNHVNYAASARRQPELCTQAIAYLSGGSATGERTVALVMSESGHRINHRRPPGRPHGGHHRHRHQEGRHDAQRKRIRCRRVDEQRVNGSAERDGPAKAQGQSEHQLPQVRRTRSQMICAPRAPSAMRNPTSGVRCVTPYAVTAENGGYRDARLWCEATICHPPSRLTQTSVNRIVIAGVASAGVTVVRPRTITVVAT